MDIVINHILPKTRLFVLHFCRRQHGSSFDQLDFVCSKTNTFSVMTQK